MCVFFFEATFMKEEKCYRVRLFCTKFSCTLRITWYTLQHHVLFWLHFSSDLSLCDHESCVTALTVKFLTKRFIGEYDPHLGKAVWKTFRYVWKLPDLCTSIFSLLLDLTMLIASSAWALAACWINLFWKKSKIWHIKKRWYITIKSLNPLFILVQFHNFFLMQPLGYNAKCETGCFLQWPVVPSFIYHF